MDFDRDKHWSDSFNEYAADPDRCEGATCSVEPFGAPDVVEVIGYDTSSDEDLAGRLADGRWFYLHAWADWTYDGGECLVADSREMLLQFGVPTSKHAAMGLT